MYVQQLQDFDVQTLKAWSVARPWRRMTTRRRRVYEYLTKLGATVSQYNALITVMLSILS